MTCTEGHAVLTREQALNLSREEKLQYFHRVTVQHPRMSQAVEDLMLLSAPNTGTDLILLIGPAYFRRSRAGISRQGGPVFQERVSRLS
jgi:hypothetical protein